MKFRPQIILFCLLASPLMSSLIFQNAAINIPGSLQAKEKRLVILHTNDTHSQVEPFSKTALRYPDTGGYARRMGVIDSIRRSEDCVLIFDDGDFSQGTPYYNFYGGRIEIEGFNRMHYDAVTLGNHEFDNGIDSLALSLRKANFPVISSNYDVSSSILQGLVQPWVILKKGGLKIGVMSTNVDPASLIMEANFKGVVFKDPLKTAQEVSEFLKIKKKCDLVICLSHLGSDSTEVKLNDFKIAHQTRYIDVILGGHSHTLLENVKTPNQDGRPVMIAQMGRSGLFLGKIDLLLETRRRK